MHYRYYALPSLQTPNARRTLQVNRGDNQEKEDAIVGGTLSGLALAICPSLFPNSEQVNRGDNQEGEEVRQLTRSKTVMSKVPCELL